METITIVTHTLAFAIGCYYAKDRNFTLIKKLWKGTRDTFSFEEDSFIANLEKKAKEKREFHAQITWENITDVRQLQKNEYVITYGDKYTFRKIGHIYHLIDGTEVHYSIRSDIDKHAHRIVEWKDLPPQVERIFPFNMVKY